MVRIALLSVVIFVTVGIAIPIYSQQQAEQQQIADSVSAEIVSVDSEKSTLVIKTVKDAVAKAYENQTISVSSEVKILKGDAVLKLSDLKVGDKVNVQYISDASGKQKVESINVEAIEAEPAAK